MNICRKWQTGKQENKVSMKHRVKNDGRVEMTSGIDICRAEASSSEPTTTSRVQPHLLASYPGEPSETGDCYQSQHHLRKCRLAVITIFLVIVIILISVVVKGNRILLGTEWLKEIRDILIGL